MGSYIPLAKRIHWLVKPVSHIVNNLRRKKVGAGSPLIPVGRWGRWPADQPSENHMISMSNTTTSISMTYDAFGNRVSKTVTNTSGTTTTQYLVDDLNPTGYPQVVDELVGPIGSAAVQRTYTYGLQRISQDQYISNAWLLSYYQYDGGGSVRQLTNSVGRVAHI